MKRKALLVIVFIISISNFSNAQDSYVVNAKTVNVRKSGSINSEILGTIKQGEVVSVINSENNSWWLISYFGIEGFVSSKLLISIEESDKYKLWKKLSANTGDNYNCENIQPQYDTSINNELIISVGNSSDAVVKLMNYSGVCIRISYIKSGEKYSMKNIPLGDYYLKIAYGKEFRKLTQDNQCIVKFLRDAVYEKGDQKLEFRKTKIGTKTIGDREYTNYDISYFELSLNLEFVKGFGKGDNFNSKKISESDFNQ